MYDLKQRHSFALPAFAKQVNEIRTLADVEQLHWQDDSYILGDGSNTVFTEDFEGHLIVNRLQGASVEELDHVYKVTLAAGENWHHWVARLIDQGIYGFENLALIPGSVGAAPVQNIGAYGVEVGEFIHRVRGVDLRCGSVFEFSSAECEFGYRSSIFKHPDYKSLMITEVEFHLPKQWQACLTYPDLSEMPENATAHEVFDHVVAVRQRKLPDPMVVPNAGSFFKNPVVTDKECRRLRQRHPDLRYFEMTDGHFKLAAAWLIDQCGLKSLRIGGAGVHQRQALVLVNSNQATGNDLVELAHQVRKQVAQRYGVWLEPEVRMLGNRGLLEL